MLTQKVILIYPKFYIMIAFLMVGVMIGLIMANSWFAATPGIVLAPMSSYDYIVVGGGTAGCVLAARLSEDSKRTVLLVEAGQQFNWLSSIPIIAPFLQKTSHDWAYVTEPQSHSSYGLLNQKSSWPRGRGLGGSNQINYLVHSFGSDEDFSRWMESGVIGWESNSLKPYMAKLHGTPSYSNISSCPNDYQYLLSRVGRDLDEGSNQCAMLEGHHLNSVLGNAFVSAGKELGLKFNHAQSTIRDGQRWTSLTDYLNPVLHRPNLHVLLNTQVDKVIWAENERRAEGIEFRGASGLVQQVRSEKEVILSAGAIGTPQILIRSGVGPRGLLEELEIPVACDLPVGFNLYDHMNMPLYVSITAPVSMTIAKILSVGQLWDYMINGKGLLASSGIVGVGTAPGDVGLVLFGMGSADERLLNELANFKAETFRALFPFSNSWQQEGFIFLASCLQPKSRGRVTVFDVCPTSLPIIDPKYLASPSDVTCMTNAVKLAAKVVSTSSFRHLGAKLHFPGFKECSFLTIDPNDDNYLECIIRTAALTGYHPGGTCKMGTVDDKSSVVDSLLRVHKVHSLRVMDASVLPIPVSGHPNSVIIAMADRASDIIISAENQ